MLNVRNGCNEYRNQKQSRIHGASVTWCLECDVRTVLRLRLYFISRRIDKENELVGSVLICGSTV
jgi:hypothetical protein